MKVNTSDVQLPESCDDQSVVQMQTDETKVPSFVVEPVDFTSPHQFMMPQLSFSSLLQSELFPVSTSASLVASTSASHLNVTDRYIAAEASCSLSGQQYIMFYPLYRS